MTSQEKQTYSEWADMYDLRHDYSTASVALWLKLGKPDASQA